MNKTVYIRKKRKFRDISSIIIMLISSISIIYIIICGFKNSSLVSNDLTSKLFISCSLVLFLMNVSIYLCLFFLSIRFIKFLFFIVTLINIGLSIFLKNYWIICMVCTYSIFVCLLYYFSIRKNNIKYNLIVLRGSSEIFGLYRIFTYLLELFFGSLFYLLIFSFAILITQNYIRNIFLLFCISIYTSWYFFGSISFFRLLFSNIIYLEIFFETLKIKSVFFLTIKNALFSLGSVLFEGINSIIYAIFYIIIKKINNGKRISKSIMTVYLHDFLKYFEDLIKFSNHWVYSYIAVTGESYRNSMEESYYVFLHSKFKKEVESLDIRRILYILYGTLFIFYIEIILFISDNLKLYFINFGSSLRISFAIYIIYVISLSVCSFDSCSKTFLFCLDDDSNIIRIKYSKIYWKIKQILHLNED